MIIDYVEVSHKMKNVTSVIDYNVFDLGGDELLLIDAKVNYPGTIPKVIYELLNTAEREKWLTDHTPCCGNRDHIGWSCDKKGCYPF